MLEKLIDEYLSKNGLPKADAEVRIVFDNEGNPRVAGVTPNLTWLNRLQQTQAEDLARG